MLDFYQTNRKLKNCTYNGTIKPKKKNWSSPDYFHLGYFVLNRKKFKQSAQISSFIEIKAVYPSLLCFSVCQ